MSDESDNADGAEQGLRDGDRLGAWRVRRLLGRGGMGVVYLCERADGAFVQKAALKIVDAPALGSQLIQRFTAERQILASLEHPNIAALLDAGTTPDGLPYLVMEYVDGEPIDRYCDAARLPVRERLALFVDVCHAVQAAHARLVVHRDIKPGNILVTGDRVVKLLDFGIAKLLDPDADTTAGQPRTRLLSPEFASPEQIRGHAVTTQSDVFSLGVLLHVLLCGHRPAQPGGHRAPGAVQRNFDHDPLPPSERAASSHDGRDIWAARRTTPARLCRQLRGDLDNIVQMALRSEPERRYLSALRMAEDVQSYLAGRPVVARPNTVAYRAWKFVRRNTLPVSVAAVTLLAIAALISASTLRLTRERDRARLAADRATQTSAFLRDLFHVVGPTGAGGDEVTARVLLDQGARRLDIMLGDQPQVRAELQDTMGQVYFRLGLLEQAQTLLSRSIPTQDALYGPEHPATIDTLLHMAEAVSTRGDYQRAQQLSEKAVVLSRTRAADQPRLLATALRVRGGVREDAGEYAASMVDLTESIRLFEALGDRDNPEYARALTLLALNHDHLGNYEQGLALLEQALVQQRAVHGALHPLTTDAQSALAVAQDRLHRYEQAEANYLEALANAMRLYGSAHPVVGEIQGNIGRLYNHMGRLADSRRYYEMTLVTTRAVYGERHHYVGYDLIALGKSSVKAGDPEAAERFFIQALEIYRETLPDAHPYVAAGLVTYARLLSDQGRYDQALVRARRARAVAVEALSEEHWLTAQVDVIIGEIYANTGQGDPRPLLESAFQRLLKMSGREHSVTQLALGYLLDELQRVGDEQAYAQYVQYKDPGGN